MMKRVFLKPITFLFLALIIINTSCKKENSTKEEIFEEYIKWELDGKPFTAKTINVERASTGELFIEGYANNLTVFSITLTEAREGQFTLGWNKGQAQFYIADNAVIYDHGYENCSANVDVYSPGSLNITKLGAVGKVISGEYVGEVYNTNGDCENNDYVVTKKPVKVTFKVKRTE